MSTNNHCDRVCFQSPDNRAATMRPEFRMKDNLMSRRETHAGIARLSAFHTSRFNIALLARRGSNRVIKLAVEQENLIRSVNIFYIYIYIFFFYRNWVLRKFFCEKCAKRASSRNLGNFVRLRSSYACRCIVLRV